MVMLNVPIRQHFAGSAENLGSGNCFGSDRLNLHLNNPSFDKEIIQGNGSWFH